MIPWKLLDTAPITGGSDQLCLYRRGGEFSIRIGGNELMNSRLHGSEEALAELACEHINTRPRPRVLIGGLGMGFTALATLDRLPPGSEVAIAELVPKVVEWNREFFGEMNGHALDDPRVTVREGDVAQILDTEHDAFDAILLDVDNGPEGFTRKGNDWLYSSAGIMAGYTALKPAGVLAVWSAHPDDAFTARLRQAGFAVESVGVRARGGAGGSRHTIWLAVRTA